MNARTKKNSHPTTGKVTVTATAMGKQRTVPYDYALSADANYGAAMGTLLNVLLTPEQQARLRHPSGAQRVHMTQKPGERGIRHWTINV